MDTAVVTLRPQTWASPKIELRHGAEGLGVFAVEAIAAGEVLVCLRHVFVDRPERHTIQLDEHVHQAGTGEMDDYFNHSCDPNAYLDFQRLQFVARGRSRSARRSASTTSPPSGTWPRPFVAAAARRSVSVRSADFCT
jgi:hypothetical protein